MKRAVLSFLFCFCIWGAWSQQISVKSFKRLDTDLSARTAGVTDQNGDVCAIIKVVTGEKGFLFEGDGNGIVKTEEKTGEYWVYVPYGSRFLTVKHDRLGVLRNHAYGAKIEKACVYELVLVTGRVTTVVEQDAGGQYFVLRVTPPDAMVYIDDVYETGADGVVTKFLSYGRHSWRVESNPYYHTEAGNVEITGDRKLERDVTLREAFGELSVVSNPESGADIFVDGEKVGTTPCTVKRVVSGEHRVRVVKAQYAPEERVVTVADGQKTNSTFTLSATFGVLTLLTDADASIWVDGREVGTGRWEGRLNKGLHAVEVRKASHRPFRKSITVNAGERRTEQLDSPEPIYGMLDVNSTPADAAIRLNGKEYGTTPQIIRNLLMGDYSVELSKAGYAEVRKNVTVEEGKTARLQLTLPSGRNVTIRTDRAGDVLQVDGKPVGTSPVKLELGYGQHRVVAIRGEQRTEKSIEVRESGGDTKVELRFGVLGKVRWSSSLTAEQKAVLEKLVKNMVFVEGGTFQMGATPEQGSGVYDDEKPVHSVTLSDYYIGKYEVTQEEWQVVMGNNPSYFKGDRLPVERVSWNDCQTFIRKLNALTGLTFRLPTEAEWEYAARGGAKSGGYKYSGGDNIDEVAWYGENYSTGSTHPVGTKRPNALGLYDMSGNVWEWCGDWYGSYSSDAQTDPVGPSMGSRRVLRGGSWGRYAAYCRVSSWISNFNSARRDFSYGFRLVLLP